MSEVKRAFNPEFLNRLDEVILFTSLVDEDLLKIMDLLVDQVNVNLVAKQIKIRLEPEAAKYILDKTCRTGVTEHVLCDARCRSTSKIRFRKRSFKALCLAQPS